MANPTISQIKVGNTTYDIKDAVANTGLELNEEITNNMSANIGAANPIPDETWTQTIRVGSPYDKALAASGSAAYINHRRHRNNDRDINSTYAAYGITRHSDLDDSNTLNAIYLWVDDDKQRKVTVSEAKPWRIGLGADQYGRWGTNLISMDATGREQDGSNDIASGSWVKCPNTAISLTAGEYVAFCFIRLNDASVYNTSVTQKLESYLSKKAQVESANNVTQLAARVPDCFELYNSYCQAAFGGFLFGGYLSWNSSDTTVSLARSHAAMTHVNAKNFKTIMLSWGTRFSLSAANTGCLWAYQNSGGTASITPGWYAWKIGTNL